MSTVSTIALAVLPLIGVALGAWLSSSSDTRKWRRDYLAATIGQRRAFHEAALLALEGQWIVLSRVALAMETRDAGTMPSDKRIDESTDEWRRVLARRYVQAMEPLQGALVEFDKARGEFTDAVNERDGSRAAEGLTAMRRARASVLNAVNLESHAINLELSEHLVSPLRSRRLRRHAPRTWTELSALVPSLHDSSEDDDGATAQAPAIDLPDGDAPPEEKILA